MRLEVVWRGICCFACCKTCFLESPCFESELRMSIIQKYACKNFIRFTLVALIFVMGDQFVAAQSGTRIIPRRTVPKRSTGKTTVNRRSGSSTRSGLAVQNSGSMRTVGLNGYCPVCIVDRKEWVKGSAQHSSQFDGMLYFFPNVEIKNKFDRDPSAFVPAMGGYDVVAKKEGNQLVQGSVFQGAAFHKGRVYVFATKRNKSMFMNIAADFEKVDLAFGGMCAVCKAAGKEQAGKSEFRFVYNKMTYLFPTAGELAEFKSDPAKYAQK